MTLPFDWSTYVPREKSTLCFVVRSGMILLIHKKRGLGAGKINGPGGRLDAGETSVACAVREVQEELLVTPTGLSYSGELLFQFASGHSIACDVYRADDCIGEPSETAEAVPLWTKVDQIPFEKMWADDRLWIPLMLEGKRFVGRFFFDDDVMVSHDLQVEGQAN